MVSEEQQHSSDANGSPRGGSDPTQRIMPGELWKRPRCVAILEYDGILSSWRGPTSDRKTAACLAALMARRFKRQRAFLTGRGPQLKLVFEDPRGSCVVWVGKDHKPALAEAER
jgi:hypothetical protein